MKLEGQQRERYLPRVILEHLRTLPPSRYLYHKVLGPLIQTAVIENVSDRNHKVRVKDADLQRQSLNGEKEFLAEFAEQRMK